MFFFPLVLSMGAVLILVFGTRKTIDTHFISQGRPPYLGGASANTGVTYDKDFERYKTQPKPVQHIEKQVVDETSDTPTPEVDRTEPLTVELPVGNIYSFLNNPVLESVAAPNIATS